MIPIPPVEHPVGYLLHFLPMQFVKFLDPVIGELFLVQIERSADVDFGNVQRRDGIEPTFARVAGELGLYLLGGDVFGHILHDDAEVCGAVGLVPDPELRQFLQSLGVDQQAYP